MYTTELIRRMPQSPQKPILFVVYSNNMIKEAELLIATIKGRDYLFDFVTVTAFETPMPKEEGMKYDVYLDPTVFMYKNSWN